MWLLEPPPLLGDSGIPLVSRTLNGNRRFANLQCSIRGPAVILRDNYSAFGIYRHSQNPRPSFAQSVAKAVGRSGLKLLTPFSH